jgi:hypothetical protein
MATQEYTVEHALKSQIIKQRHQKETQFQLNQLALNHLIVAWKALSAVDTNEKIVRKMIWDFVEDETQNGYHRSYLKKLKSTQIGVLSKIDDYTNKKGETFKAHFTIYGNYIGKVSSLGDKPIEYEGNFVINKSQFAIRINVLKDTPIEEIQKDFSIIFFPKSKFNVVSE